MSVLGIIPARLASTRLPRKPLYPILGKPLIQWTWERVAAMDVLDRVVIATDSEEIVEVCEGFGASVVLTSADHKTGTDRCAEVARMPEYEDFEYIVNVQCDEPLIEESHVGHALDIAQAQFWDVGTCSTPITESEALCTSVVKVATSDKGQARHFSRAPIKGGSYGYLRHIGIYAYTLDALEKWGAFPQTPLEIAESLEQLRALDLALRIGVAVVEHAHAAIDTSADVARFEELLGGLSCF